MMSEKVYRNALLKSVSIFQKAEKYIESILREQKLVAKLLMNTMNWFLKVARVWLSILLKDLLTN